LSSCGIVVTSGHGRRAGDMRLVYGHSLLCMVITSDRGS